MRGLVRDTDTAGLKQIGSGSIYFRGTNGRVRLRSVPADFLIFDETLAHVDQAFARECDAFFERLADTSTTVIVTSHDAGFLRRHCRRALWLDVGKLRMEGPAAAVIDA